MNKSLRIRLGAVVLALLTVAAIVFAVLNFQQRSRFIVPDDGVTWVDTTNGVAPGTSFRDLQPIERASVRAISWNRSTALPIHRATDATRVLWRLGPWSDVRYGIRRGGGVVQVPLVTEPQANPSSIENYLRLTALLYLFIGLFIFVRRWNAPRAIHFYVFCLASFVLYSFHYTGKLNSFDWTVYWSNVVALLLQPALLVHFALGFPERRARLWPQLLGVYGVPAALLALHIFVATAMLDFLPSMSSRDFLATLDLFYVGIYFLFAAAIFLASYLRAPSGVLKQQLKWVTAGTFAGILPFFLLYVVPRLVTAVPQPWMKLSVFSLVLIPLSFGYAIIRYRLMDVDIIFKRGLAYTFATAGTVVGLLRGHRADWRAFP